MRRSLAPTAAGALVVAAVAAASAAFPAPAEPAPPLVRLAAPGPWPVVSGLVGYRGRIWFASSVKYDNHNSAEIYSYGPGDGDLRYDRHLFSQDAGEPLVAAGLLWWPFEDARFSAGRGEAMVTDGRDWAWLELAESRAFHTHAMAWSNGALFAATSAWRPRLLRSPDLGRSWETLWERPTPEGRVARVTSLAVLGGALFGGLSSRREAGPKLLRLDGNPRGAPVPGWPDGQATDELTPFGGRLYAITHDESGSALWRTDGRRSGPVPGLATRRILALAAGPRALWAVTAREGGGRLWRSPDGERWRPAQDFAGETPVDVAVHGGGVYVGTSGGRDRPGALWGPPPGGVMRAPPPGAPPPLPVPVARPLSPDRIAALLDALDEALAGAATFSEHRRRLHAALGPLARTRDPEVGAEIARHLAPERRASWPARVMPAIGGAVSVPLADANAWYLLRALAANGHGRVPVALLRRPWDRPPNPSEKYFHPAPAAAWAVAAIGQDDADTLAALVERLGAPGDPDWLAGDVAGALTALTGERFGLDRDAWRRWWALSRPPPR